MQYCNVSFLTNRISSVTVRASPIGTEKASVWFLSRLGKRVVADDAAVHISLFPLDLIITIEIFATIIYSVYITYSLYAVLRVLQHRSTPEYLISYPEYSEYFVLRTTVLSPWT
jgi:hypothetical protein